MPKVFIFRIGKPTDVLSLTVAVIEETEEEAAKKLKEDLDSLRLKHGGALEINPNSDLYSKMLLNIDTKVISPRLIVGSGVYDAKDEQK